MASEDLENPVMEEETREYPLPGREEYRQGYFDFLKRSKKVEVKDLIPLREPRGPSNCENFMHLKQFLDENFSSHLITRNVSALSRCHEICRGIKQACVDAACSDED